ncbi:DEAD/DEAH box helicase [Natribacillus halophilus]|uniref:Helicase conserved C-terminal domain-containing protein n=1 Tax=Natribacillus halophilus TaxID=549003 RepID=A0A1G8JMG9_9BACI|nr:SNF2-related protein [Natribacillus halophilus]SDI32197.1 Helicase conserved C-terminal domain-containing protein [Natribacillus halophilus]
MHIDISFSTDWEETFKAALDNEGPWASWEMFSLAYEAEEHKAVPSFDGLVAPTHLPELSLYDHQWETARRVVEDMNGKAILADEVGLGKTIEAGLVLKEYMIRGLVKKALILSPASLVNQWTQELNEKFYIPAVPQKKTYVWDQCDVVVASMDTAKRAPHRDIVMEQPYDMIIIDEAHKLKNANTKNYAFIKSLKKRFCLLCTATPVQNRIEELFHLVSILKPGHLGDERSFKAQYKHEQASEDIQALVQNVMVRNRRDNTNVTWTKRHVENYSVEQTEEERAMYDAVCDLKQTVHDLHGFSLTTLQREACSSKEALGVTISNMLKKGMLSEEQVTPLVTIMNQVKTNAKAEQVLKQLQASEEKTVIFTEYRATQLYLQWFLAQHKIRSVPFRGGFNRGKKDYMRMLFRDHVPVMIATEAGGEGLNLQFCHHMINYDLPWNPMRVEQRIGRIHRLGQEQDVHITNYAIDNTVEQRILHLLYEKINMFEGLIGRLDDILERYSGQALEKYVEDALDSGTEGEARLKLHHLTELMNQEDDPYETGRSS